METVNSPVVGEADAHVKHSQGQKSWLFEKSKSEMEREVALVTFPKFVPAPSRDELLDLASAYNASLGW